MHEGCASGTGITVLCSSLCGLNDYLPNVKLFTNWNLFTRLPSNKPFISFFVFCFSLQNCYKIIQAHKHFARFVMLAAFFSGVFFFQVEQIGFHGVRSPSRKLPILHRSYTSGISSRVLVCLHHCRHLRRED